MKKQIFLVLAVILCLTGCSSGKLLREYREDAIRNAWQTTSVASRKQGMAATLCVANDNVIPEGMEAMAGGAALFDLSTKQTLYASNVHEKMCPASITKIMTALVFLEHYQGDFTDVVTASANVAITESGAQLCGYKEGDQATVEQLLHGLLLYSGNDAAIMLAEYTAGSVDAFVDLMNQRAAQLGATHTHFVNPHGLSDEEHYTTVYDLYLIFQRVTQFEKFRTLINTPTYEGEYTLSNGETKKVSWKSTNLYLNGDKQPPEGVAIIGGKTGTTKAAGSCLILLSRGPSGDEYVSVVLRDENKDNLYADMSKLLSKIDK